MITRDVTARGIDSTFALVILLVESDILLRGCRKSAEYMKQTSVIDISCTISLFVYLSAAPYRSSQLVHYFSLSD
jgi:hypothetical protein